MQFTAIYVLGDDGFIVVFVEEFPNIVTQGVTMEDARENVIDAVKFMLKIGRREAARSTEGRDILAREVLTIEGDDTE